MANDQLLSEIERQRKYLGELPENFEFPLFNVRHAVESQRASGYRHTAAAAREMTDSAVRGGRPATSMSCSTPTRRAAARPCPRSRSSMTDPG